ncbi:MAG: hypothetical protein ABH829_03975 [archaeon]
MKSDGRTDFKFPFRVFRLVPWENSKLEKRGWRGVVYKADTEKGVICLKVLRNKVPGTSLKSEAEMLKKANAVGVGPKLLGYDRKMEAIAMEFAGGEAFGKWVGSAPGARIRKVVLDVLSQAKRLDGAGIDHGQLSSAPKHIIVGKKIVLIDFERGSSARKPHNFNSLLSFLVLNPNSETARLVRKAFGLELGEIKKLVADGCDVVRLLSATPAESTCRSSRRRS